MFSKETLKCNARRRNGTNIRFSLRFSFFKNFHVGFTFLNDMGGHCNRYTYKKRIQILIFHKNISKYTKNFSASGITFKNKILKKIGKYLVVRSPINFLSFYGSDKKIFSEKLVVFDFFFFFLRPPWYRISSIGPLPSFPTVSQSVGWSVRLSVHQSFSLSVPIILSIEQGRFQNTFLVLHYVRLG